MADRTELLHSTNLLHCHKSLIYKRFLNLASDGVKLVKHFAITRVEKHLFIYAYKQLGKNPSLASLLHRIGKEKRHETFCAYF
jgi:hypothetical protein